MKKCFKFLIAIVISFASIPKTAALDLSRENIRESLDKINENVTDTYNNAKEYYNNVKESIKNNEWNSKKEDEGENTSIEKPRRTNIEFNDDVYLKDGNAGFEVGLDVEIVRNKFYFDYLYDVAANLDLQNKKLDVKYENDLTIDLNYKELDHLEVETDPIEIEENTIPDLSSVLVYKVYTNGQKEQVTDFEYSKDKVIKGMESIEISYTENGITKTASVPIIVKEKVNASEEQTINTIAPSYTSQTSTLNPKTNDNIINHVILGILSLIGLNCIYNINKKIKMSN